MVVQVSQTFPKSEGSNTLEKISWIVANHVFDRTYLKEFQCAFPFCVIYSTKPTLYDLVLS